MPNVMNTATIRELLSSTSAKMIGDIQTFDEIDSTNAEAIRLLRAGESQSGLLVATSQSAGRGRRGREWLSPANGGLYLSFYRSFDISAEGLQGLSLVTALSLHSALSELGVSNLQLKWPNDVLHSKKKLAGILLELQRNEERNCIVFGIGINLSLPKEIIKKLDRPVTDLETISRNKLPQKHILVATIINHLCDNLLCYQEQGFQAFAESWNTLDCYVGNDIVIEIGGKRSIGRSLGVDPTGALILQTASGRQTISGGEIFPSLRESSVGENSESD